MAQLANESYLNYEGAMKPEWESAKDITPFSPFYMTSNLLTNVSDKMSLLICWFWWTFLHLQMELYYFPVPSILNACKMPLPHAADSPGCRQDQATTQHNWKHAYGQILQTFKLYSTKVLAMAMTAIKGRVSVSEKKTRTSNFQRCFCRMQVNCTALSSKRKRSRLWVKGQRNYSNS